MSFSGEKAINLANLPSDIVIKIIEKVGVESVDAMRLVSEIEWLFFHCPKTLSNLDISPMEVNRGRISQQ